MDPILFKLNVFWIMLLINDEKICDIFFSGSTFFGILLKVKSWLLENSGGWIFLEKPQFNSDSKDF